jgi:hypothetical protein
MTTELVPLQYQNCRTFGDSFPANNPLTPWMFQIATIRDDVAFEVHGLVCAQEDDGDAIWRCNYFLRKICISLREAATLFNQKVQPYGNRCRAQSPKLGVVISRARQAIEAALVEVKPIRDTLGAHIRPPGAGEGRGTKRSTNKAWQHLATQTAAIVVDFEDKRRTSYRGATYLSSSLAWPDAASLQEIMDSHMRLQNAVETSARAAIGAIDVVLAQFWVDIGVIPVPETNDIGVGLPTNWPLKSM